ncbi:probable fucosyltransferase 8 [Selaginella moellendorffii]|nr:probable fucosyltransferase 8 [Selaginella moellendorffii]|eukprot:XP_024535889.1 probable fucosyltransferase 8 [Selaginella moellendorffii]
MSAVLPYGKLYFDGRWTHGYTIGDFLAQAFGLLLFLPYLQPGTNFSSGVNFASAGAASTSSADLEDSFEQLFPEHLRDFQPCASLPKNSAERSVCSLLSATSKQISLLKSRSISNSDNSTAYNFTNKSSSCKYKDENGPSLHRYATERSPELAALLDRYAQMHSLCVGAEYHRLHDARYRPACRYVVWSCTFGLGNRLMSLVSAFLYAILSQRVLLVDNDGWEKLFCEPFPGSTWRMPRGMDSSSSQASSFSAFYKTSARSSSNCAKNSSNCHRSSLPRAVPLAFRSKTDPAEHKFLVCPSATRSLRDIPVIYFKNSNQYFAPGFFLNPALQPALAALFPSRRVFHDLGRYLLNPSDSVWPRIARLHRTLIAGATRSFGVQIRDFEGKYTSYFDTTVPLCIQQRTGICPIEEEDQNKGEYTFSVYVATIVAGHVAAINATLAASGLRFKLGHQRADGAQLDDVGHQEKAVADMWLLSHADVLLTSGMSTFGYTAQGLAGVVPYRLTHWPKDPCLVAVSSDPCFHFGPPKGMRCDEDGFGLGEDNARGTQNVVWPCKDFAGTGLQLVEP